MARFTIRYKGGSGSGNFGHAGRKGQLGGSAPAGGAVGGGTSARETGSIAPLSRKNFKAKYPVLYESLDMLVMDSGGSIKRNLSVGFDTYDDMDKVNHTLAKLKGKTLGEVLPKSTKWDNFDETPDNDALETFAIGEYSAQQALVRAFGKDGKFASNWLNEVFDGKYTDTFLEYD